MTAGQATVHGRYRLGRTLGAGGMGRVWQARDEILDRDVALKEILLPGSLLETDRDALHRQTLREARAAARLAHPAVARVYDTFEGDGRAWIVMEYVPSRSLQQVIDTDGPLPPERAAEIGLAVLAALAAAHAAGVRHRDVKPANVLLAEDGRVVLTDFGVAAVDGESLATSSGLVLGSPQYMAPERVRNGVTTPAADLWSLGATLFAAVEGHSPYARRTVMETVTALATEEPSRPTRAGALTPVLDGLLRKDPDERIGADETERLLWEALEVPWEPAEPQQVAARGRASAPVVTPISPPASDQPVSDQPASDQPAPDQPVSDQPVSDQPASDRVAPGRLALGQPALGQPAPDQPAPDQPVSDQPVSDQPASDRVAPGRAAPDQPASDQPASDRAVPDLPAPYLPAPDPPAPDPPVADPPVADPPVADPPVADPTAVDPGPAEPRRRSKLLAGVVAVLVFAGAVIGWLVSRPADQPTAGSAPQPTAGVPASATDRPSAPASASASTSGPASASPSASSSPGRPALPAGWMRYRDPTGFSLYVPRGWKRSKEGSIVYFRTAGHVLGIDQTDKPQWDPVADWRGKAEYRVARGDFPSYHAIHIREVKYFIKAADWEFTFTRSGVRQHVNNRGFITSRTQAYGIYWQCSDAAWPAAEKDLQLIFDSFRPVSD